MTTRRADIREVFARLSDEGLVDDGWETALDEMLAEESRASPWFLRAMVGFGAWLAAVLLIIFVVSMSVLTTGGGYMVLGIVFMAGATAFRYRFHNDFASQLALAVSLAGQGLFAFSIFEGSGPNLDLEAMLSALIAINGILIFVFPDKTHRFLSVLLVVGSLCGLLYSWEVQSLVPLLGPALSALFVLMLQREPAFVEQGRIGMLMPIRAGVLISAFGCLMLSTIYVLPELVGDYQFYPRPWISSLLFGALLLYAESRIVGSIYGDAAGARRIAVYALTVIVVLAALPAPGLILSLFVIVISSVHGNSLYRGAGIAFVAVFTAAYFYGIDVGMLVKSASLAGTGIVVLVCRWLFLRSVVVAPASAGPGSPGDVATGAPESRVAEHKEINPHA